MFTVKIETGFYAFHQVMGPDGTYEPLHSHDWKVAVEVVADQLDSTGVAMDFQLLKDLVDNITSKISNKQMGNIDFFIQNSSSTENVAKYIYDKLEPQLPAKVRLQCVAVTERPGCSVKFCK